MKLPLILTAVVALTFPAVSQQTRILTAEKHNEYGLVYSLPLTALQIHVTGQRETFKAGPFNQYARRYLGMSDVITEDRVVSSVTGISVTPVGVKGSDTQYLMQLKAGQTAFIGVDSDGMLLSINTQPKVPSKPDMSTGNKIMSSSSGGNIEDYLKYVDMDFVSAQSSIKQAEMLANSIMELRESRAEITNGTTDNMPSDGRQHELMINSLNNQIDALTRAFTGTSSLEEFSADYLYIPDKEGEEVLLRLSDYEGFVEADDYSGSPVYISVEITYEAELPVDVNGETKKLPKDAVMYAIPGAARVKIYTGSNTLYDKELTFAQYGVTFGLDPKLFTDKKAPTFATFSPITGALLEIGRVGETGAPVSEE